MEVNLKRRTAWRHSEAGSQEDVITRQPVGTDRGDQEVGGINNPPNSTTNEGNGGLKGGSFNQHRSRIFGDESPLRLQG